MLGAERNLVGALALDLDALALVDLELVPEVERGAGAVEAGAEVRGRRGRPYPDRQVHRAASAIASGSGSTITAAESSARRWPGPSARAR